MGKFINLGVLAVLLLTFEFTSIGKSDGINDVWPGAFVAFDAPKVLFPNWLKAPTAGFMIYECDDLTCPGCAVSSLTSMTMLNYGTATGGGAGDIKAMYFNIVCGSQNTALATMTFAGNWNMGSGTYPAWTWAGAIPNSVDPCDTKNGCWCYQSILVYTDISSCPTDGASIVLGPGFNSLGDPGVRDSCGMGGPSGPYTDEMKTIRYVMKTASPKVVAPGDTISYAIYYGKPGTPNISNLIVTDSMPTYTHWNNVANPLPDPGWDPNPGPPSKLRWTFPALVNTAGGATGQITFQLTADWGNGESFEPGSGDQAAPEGEFLRNYAHLSWSGGGCASGRTSEGVSTSIRRFIFWKIGDNDLLFASRSGLSDDEMIYSITAKNVSTTKTWWNVQIWDTVPPEIIVWDPSFGVEDSCLGWTMTPSGCAIAGAGVVLNGTKTILTWKLDMPPQMTITIRWKGHVNPQSPAGSTAVNIASIMEVGKTNIVGGTGHQKNPKNFVHIAPLVLRTTFISYAGIGGSGMGKRGMHIHFFPLNRMTNFELRALEALPANPWALNGGLSPSINTYLGSCVGGFNSCSSPAGAGAGGVAGCKAERAPAGYFCWSEGLPDARPFGECLANCGTDAGCGDYPDDGYHYIYKVVSNTPILWQMFSCGCGSGQDQQTYAPSTSLSFSGYVHYFFDRKGYDRLNIINTSIGPSGVLDPTLINTVHIFTWDHVNLEWIYRETTEIDAESQYMPDVLNIACNEWYKVVSSPAKSVVHIGYFTYFGPDANNFATMSPTRNVGNLSSGIAGEAFYLFPGVWDSYLDVQAVVTNMGPVAASYRIERYQPRDTSAPGPGIPAWLSDTSGTWTYIKTDSVAPGLPWPPAWTPPNYNTSNPHVYGTLYDNTYIFSEPPGSTAGMWRIVLESGGPIEICSGSRIFSTYSGSSLLHASDGRMYGSDFWLGMGWNWIMSSGHCNSPFTPLYSLDVFCPATGMVVTGYDTMGYTARYTTTGNDQCVAFQRISDPGSGARKIFRVQISGPATDAIAMYTHCQPSHKFVTAPFLATGVHYDIIAPAFAYIGQNFWITIVVVNAGGGTKTNYSGTTSFSSTDPGAKIQATPMDTYNYTWIPATDNGVKIFVNVTMTRLGLVTIVASDILDGSIMGLTSIQIVGADVKLEKFNKLSVAASGDTVQFRICWSNYSTATAYSFTITDAVPRGTDYVPELSNNAVCGQNGPATAAVTLALAVSSSTTPPNAAFTTIAAGTSGSNTARWLRWTVRDVYVNSTGCVCFKVVVN